MEPSREPLKELKAGDDARRNWIQINSLLSTVREQQKIIERHEAAIEKLRRPQIDGGGSGTLSVWRP